MWNLPGEWFRTGYLQGIDDLYTPKTRDQISWSWPPSRKLEPVDFGNWCDPTRRKRIFCVCQELQSRLSINTHLYWYVKFYLFFIKSSKEPSIPSILLFCKVIWCCIEAWWFIIIIYLFIYYLKYLYRIKTSVYITAINVCPVYMR